MRAYLDLVQQILDQGTWRENRTGVRTLSVPGVSLRFDLQQGFPAVTTKRLAFRTAMGELVGFLRATNDAGAFRELGCRVWDQNANESPAWVNSPWRAGTDDLGPIYGVQWRAWPAYKLLPEAQSARIAAAQAAGYRVVDQVRDGGVACVLLHKAIDQLGDCLETIVRDPGSRRILFHGWNCAQLDEMALPPCHLLYQFLPDAGRRELSLCLYVRSNDVGLGAPFNLVEGSALLHLVARLTGYTPRWFSYFAADAHIYENHIPMLREQLKRTPYPLPQLQLAARIPAFADTGRCATEWLARVQPDDFVLQNYRHHAPLGAPMAV